MRRIELVLRVDLMSETKRMFGRMRMSRSSRMLDRAKMLEEDIIILRIIFPNTDY